MPDPALHTPLDFGVPYGRADVTDDGHYTVTCPVCGLVLTSAAPHDDVENDPRFDESTDDVTKVAGFRYAAHYEIAGRLEYLRSQIDAECISYGELAELQGLADHIDPGDVVLLEWAGVPEFPEPEVVTVEVPVVLIFKVPAGTDEADLALAVEATFEHSSLRESFHGMVEQLNLGEAEEVGYDGYSLDIRGYGWSQVGPGERRLVIELEDRDQYDTPSDPDGHDDEEVVARVLELIEAGYSSGIYPTWTIEEGR